METAKNLHSMGSRIELGSHTTKMVMQQLMERLLAKMEAKMDAETEATRAET
jgi:hypothetical protein